MLIDWCPQVCIGTQDKGFLVDIVEAFSRKENIKLSYVWVPRSRALIDVKKGKYDLLISPSEREANGLILHKEEIGTQQICFYAKKSNNWKYQGPHSITKDIVISAIQDTSMSDLEDFAKKNSNNFKIYPVLDGAEEILVKQLHKGYSDIFMYTSRGIDDYLLKNPQYSSIEKKGCLLAEKLYVGLRPTNPVWADKMGKRIDSFIRQAHRDGLIDKIMKKYGYEDWKNTK